MLYLFVYRIQEILAQRRVKRAVKSVFAERPLALKRIPEELPDAAPVIEADIHAAIQVTLLQTIATLGLEYTRFPPISARLEGLALKYALGFFVERSKMTWGIHTKGPLPGGVMSEAAAVIADQLFEPGRGPHVLPLLGELNEDDELFHEDGYSCGPWEMGERDAIRSFGWPDSPTNTGLAYLLKRLLSKDEAALIASVGRVRRGGLIAPFPTPDKS